MEARRAKTWRSQGLVYDSRTPKGQAQSIYIVIHLRATQALGLPRCTRQLCLPAQNFFDLFGELNLVSDLAQIVAS